jgi:WD40 repeat protein
VRYNVDDNLQRSFYRVSNAVSCLAVSFDGKYLAVGERCQSPSITVWNITTGVQVTVNSTHKHGISSLAFSPDSQYLVSAGFKHDKQLILWDWEAARKLCVQKLGNKVNSMTFNYDGSFFVTCGDRHLKWWYLTTGKNADGSIDITGKAASILEAHKNAVFMDIKIGIDNSVYCATSTGLLCAFNDTRYMKMWVQLESRVSYSIALLENAGADICQNIVIVGSSEGYIRAYSAKDLRYIATLPLPEPSMGSFSKPALSIPISLERNQARHRRLGSWSQCMETAVSSCGTSLTYSTRTTTVPTSTTPPAYGTFSSSTPPLVRARIFLGEHS